MMRFRNAVCAKCHKTFNYLYSGGRPRKRCFDCSPPKGKPRRSYNAYDRRRPFPWGYLPSDWFVSKAGNACRTLSGHCIAVYERGGHFWFSVPTMRDERPRISEIQATQENVGQALRWAERMTENLLRSLATH